MTAKEISELTLTEIDAKVAELRTALLSDRLKKQTGQVTKTHLFRARRKDIARLLTVKNQKLRASAAVSS
jgi:ribosomal protein L29